MVMMERIIIITTIYIFFQFLLMLVIVLRAFHISGFFNLGSLDDLGWIILCWEAGMPCASVG